MLYQTELPEQMRAHARDRTKDLQIFSLTLSQLSYMGVHSAICQDISVKLSLQLENKKSPWKKKTFPCVRLPGIEPGSNAWEASMITITLQAPKGTPGGDRTRDPRLIRPMLCL